MAARPRDVVVVGASAGGVEALRTMVAGLPPDLPASVLVVLHMPVGGTSALQVEDGDLAPDIMRWENEIAHMGRAEEGAETVATPSEFACPDCHGVLSGIDGDMRYRCRVGHAWTAEALLAAQGSALERAQLTALRTLEEKTALSMRMAASARECGIHGVAERYERMARETTEAAAVLRQQVTGSG